MPDLPLLISAHPSVWSVDAEIQSGVLEASLSDSTICHHCGQPLQGWPEPYHLNDDHADNRPANLVASCPLCHLAQHLNRPTIESEAVLVWIPEMTQRAVVGLARAAHVSLFRDGLSPASERPPGERSSRAAKAAYVTLRTLRGRSKAAAQLLGTNSPRVLGAALIGLDRQEYDRRSARLAGIHLLPTGRLFRDGHDVYEQLLDAWSSPPALQPES